MKNKSLRLLQRHCLKRLRSGLQFKSSGSLPEGRQKWLKSKVKSKATQM